MIEDDGEERKRVQINYRNYTFYRSFGLMKIKYRKWVTIRELKSKTFAPLEDDKNFILINYWASIGEEILFDFTSTNFPKTSQHAISPDSYCNYVFIQTFSPFLIIIIFFSPREQSKIEEVWRHFLLCFSPSSFTILLYPIVLLAFGLRFHANVSRWL